MAEQITDALSAIQDRMSGAALAAQRETSSVTLVAVSKTKPVELIEEAYAAGQRHFGENRLQELEQKAPALPDDCIWHFIGTVQRNKVRKILAHADTIHAVDSLKLLSAISRIAGEMQITAHVFLQIHIGGEESKHGFGKDEVVDQLAEILALPHLQIEGLMCIPPPARDDAEARAYFRELVDLRNHLRTLCPLPLDSLSMGMSGDFEAAITEGATHVRVGSSIFGSRS